MNTVTRSWTSRAPLVACLVALPLVLAACGSNSTATTTPTPTPSTSPSVSPAVAVITSAWEKFFAGTTPAAAKMTLLQDAKQFAKTIAAQASSALAKCTQAKVTAVKVSSPTTATVTYPIIEGGQVALPNQTGQAVLQGGAWKVSAPSFQALLKLEQGQTSASPSASP